MDAAPPSLRGSRVLVTGASGFTGGHLARALLGTGARVRVFARRAEAVAGLAADGAEAAIGDIRDARAVDAAVEGCEQVYHVAALYRDASGPEQAYWDVNVTGTEHVLASCERHRVKRLLHCSTMGVHGSVSQVPSDETAPFKPGDAYQRSKLAGEEGVWAWFRRTGIPTAVIRPAGIYGPGDLRFLKLFRAIRGGWFVMLGHGRTWYHQVYIDDLVRGFLLCGTRPEAVGEPFCISSGAPLRLNELVALVAEAVGVPAPRRRIPVWPVHAAAALCEAVCVPLGVNPPLHRRRVHFFINNRGWTSRKADRLLGYVSTVDHRDGLERTARWYEAQGLLAPPVNGKASR